LFGGTFSDSIRARRFSRSPDAAACLNIDRPGEGGYGGISDLSSSGQVSGARGYGLSLAGPFICPSCDVERQKEVERQRKSQGWRDGQ
jgi:hypothetical protein